MDLYPKALVYSLAPGSNWLPTAASGPAVNYSVAARQALELAIDKGRYAVDMSCAVNEAAAKPISILPCAFTYSSKTKSH